jgi:hypothetical protein
VKRPHASDSGSCIFFRTLNFQGKRKLIIGSVALNKNIFQKTE